MSQTPSQSQSLLHNIRQLFAHIGRRRQAQFVAVVLLMILGAASEAATLGAVLPFLTLFAQPDGTSCVIKFIPCDLSLNTATVLFVSVVIVSTVLRLVLAWCTARFVYSIASDLGTRVFRAMLFQPYAYHVSINSSQSIAAVNKVGVVLAGVISPLMILIVAVTFASTILAVLIAIDPVTSSVALASFSALYIGISLYNRRRLRIYGREVAVNEALRIQAIQEGLGGIRDVTIDGTQSFFLSRFQTFDVRQRNAQGRVSFLATAPRFVIEAVGMVAIVGVAWWLSARNGGFAGAVPTLGVFALGAQRILPQMQQIYAGWVTISSTRAVLGDVLEFLNLPVPADHATTALPSPAVQLAEGEPLIALDDVSFRYTEDGPMVLDRVNLQIRRGARVGFVGKTGSGKSTLSDVIMGLLDPTSGSITVNGQALGPATRAAWHKRIAHVPQSIYLGDLTIAQNIAFGVDFHRIDLDRVKDAARKADIAAYIENLPQGYDTFVGERGVRLSGGQRQRIGLARALYKQADVVVLDEATSALDDATEHAVIHAIESLGREVTILMIAHRTTTLRGCDMIVELSGGKIVGTHTYEGLISSRRPPRPQTA